MKLTKMIYLASPYTFKSPSIRLSQRRAMEEYRFNEITRIAGLLQNTYPYAFILPITMSHLTAKTMKKQSGEFAYWSTRDYTYISRCDELWVAMMDGWRNSVGILNEIKFAISHGIKVRYLDVISLKLFKEHQIETSC